VTDGRFSGGTKGLMIGHVSPEAQVCGPIALVEEGDTITIDCDKGTLELVVDAAVLEVRKAKWTAPELEFKQGLFARYARLVSSAKKGAILE
jgi:dihydroxy-acid dehydratase